MTTTFHPPLRRGTRSVALTAGGSTDAGQGFMEPITAGDHVCYARPSDPRFPAVEIWGRADSSLPDLGILLKLWGVMSCQGGATVATQSSVAL